MEKIYINFSTLSNKQLIDLWNFVFKKSNQFSFRFPNYNHSTSNSMDIKYNDNAQIDQVFCDYLDKNSNLINECNKYLIKKCVSNKYFDDKYSNLSIVYYCRIFDYLKKLVIKKPNIFEWLEPDLPEDLSFFINDKLFVYVCSHEDICIFYVNADDKAVISKIIEL